MRKRVKLTDVRAAAERCLHLQSGKNDPILFLWALGIDIVRDDGSVIGEASE